MKNNIYIKISGYPEDIKDLTAMLEKNNIRFQFAPKGTKPVERVKEKEKPATMKYSRQIRIAALYWEGLLYIIVVEVTKELIKAIINWLKEKRKERVRKPRLIVEVQGNILDLNQKNMKVLKKLLKESKQKSFGLSLG